MISHAFHVGVYVPLYNALIGIVDWMPFHDMGFAIIALTIVVRLVLYPLSKRAIASQQKMKEVAPAIEEVKKKFKDDLKAQNEAIFKLYREKGVNPFSGLLLLLIQIPILLALYWIFALAGLPTVDTTLLYSFVHAPESIHMQFLGVIDLGGKSMVLAVLVALSQALYTRLAMGPRTKQIIEKSSFSEDMAASFDLQARYALPVLFGVFSYYVAAAAPLYWLTGNCFMIAQEYLSGRRFSDIQRR
ncbi:membrane protein insertase YidC [bacterium]|nr:membrane protein insertase YidC [bacterium]